MVDQFGRVVGVENNVAEMEVDIVVEDAPDTVTIQHEQFQEIAGLAQAGMPIPPDLLIEMSQLRNKDQIIERMQQGQQQAPPDPMAQVAAEMELEQRQADIDKTNAETAEKEAKALSLFQPPGMLQ